MVNFTDAKDKTPPGVIFLIRVVNFFKCEVVSQ